MKINRLLQVWPSGTVALHPFLARHGVSHKLAEQYRKGGWLDAVGVGAFLRHGDKVGWEGAVYALQRHAAKAIRPGGRTALEMLGMAHYVRMAVPRVDLYGPPGLRLPRWLAQHAWKARFRYFGTSLFTRDIGLATRSVRDFELTISSPERAILEVLEGVPREIAFEEAQQLMEGLPTLRAKSMQALLEACTSVKVKRLCLYLADATRMPWRAGLKDERFDLGTGKRQVVVGGQLNGRYGITVPRETGT